jgi:hypothetical protein
MNMNIMQMLQALQQQRGGGNTAFAGGSPTFRESGRAIPAGPMPSGGFGSQMPPQNARPMPLPQPMPMPQQQGGWGQPSPSPWGSGGPMSIAGQPSQQMMPSMGPRDAMQGGLGSLLGGVQQPQMQQRTLGQIMSSMPQQQSASPWGSGGPMRSRGGVSY